VIVSLILNRRPHPCLPFQSLYLFPGRDPPLHAFDLMKHTMVRSFKAHPMLGIANVEGNGPRETLRTMLLLSMTYHLLGSGRALQSLGPPFRET
jgi:hypothetical protein